MATEADLHHKYHHGDLRAALIEATEQLLAERGVDAFSLREVARRAGVSPAAPAHHFGDAAGLLTVVATAGFAELARGLDEGDRCGGDDARAALCEQGVAYVRFALQWPGRFRLMFRQGLRDDAELQRCGTAAYEVLARGVARAWRQAPAAAGSEAVRHESATALWALVHGYAHLAIAGKLGAPGCEGDAAVLLKQLRSILALTVGGLFDAVPGSALAHGRPLKTPMRAAHPARPAQAARPKRSAKS